MFCYQCEQTAMGSGCTVKGVCGKDSVTAGLQDLLVHATKGVALYAHQARQLGVVDHETDVFVIEALFTTVTNVDFDPQRLSEWLTRARAIRTRIKGLYAAACQAQGVAMAEFNGATKWEPAADLAGLTAQGEAVSVTVRRSAAGDDLAGLAELVMYGLKGAAAYLDHAHVLGFDDDALFAEFHAGLAFLADINHTAEEYLGWALRAGELNYKVMELLDRANRIFGDRVPAKVRVTPVKGKAILVSGHDLLDLSELLKQTAGKGINIYTHGEMLPAHAYPELAKYPHLVGNYGGAWQDQAKEFDAFPGAILMTTNCIQKPKETYQARIFTCGLVAWPDVTHITGHDFTPLIEAALAAPGFSADEPAAYTMTGFSHEPVLGLAGTVIDAVKAGKIRHFFLIGGCDGAKSGRNYYTELATQVPDDCVILTLACGKYRFNKLEFGDIGGIPRLLDMGQCNDAYSAIKVALALAEAFGVGVNELPLSLVLSWYEQKAVAILLTLLYLGVQNIRIGPSLPAFVSPTVLSILVEKFGLKPITTPEADLAAILGSPAAA